MTKPPPPKQDVPAGSTANHQSRGRSILLSKATGIPKSIYTIACRRRKSADCAGSELQDTGSACAAFGCTDPLRG
ncbi:hypothetical protein PDIG_82410 [Penicillium digitatum PHI26]|uniref:Uncharacterized protein n=2 Tax=Penicillium digitatum TaxID=36651 RepID=K9F976_PEND2|nr:hypothetical protein PDIP_88750 [Penicillium digitatum Pd1]EKV04094.1 hypothetical protein PDIP_88750 [Penicillium digitatum Pd1]EKV05699.1 hypothetical protein PDIG_82410 [Penicillium digitatum PHI26]